MLPLRGILFQNILYVAKLFIELEKFKFLRLYLAKFAALRGGFLVPLVGSYMVFVYSATFLVALG